MKFYSLYKLKFKADYLQALGSNYLNMLAYILIQVIFTPFYIKIFGKYQFGILVMLTNISNIVIIGISWMSGSSLRLLGEYYAKKDYENFRITLGIVKFIYLIYGILIFLFILLIILIFPEWLFHNASQEDKHHSLWALALMGGYLPIVYTTAVERVALTAQQQQVQANLAQFSSIVTFICLTTIWLYFGGNMPGVMAINIVGALASLWLSRYFLQKNHMYCKFIIPVQRYKYILKKLGGKTGTGYFLHGIIMIASQADITLIGWLGGANVAANFYLLWKIPEALIQLVWKIPDTLTPYFIGIDVSQGYQQLKEYAYKTYLITGCIAIIPAITYMFLGRKIVSLWVGAQHVPQTKYGFIIAGSAIFWLSLARLPVILKAACASLRSVNIISFIEIMSRWSVTILLFPYLGFIALPLSTNIVHITGISFAYYRLLANR